LKCCLPDNPLTVKYSALPLDKEHYIPKGYIIQVYKVSFIEMILIGSSFI
jgi:hypothetical protein